MRTEELIFTNAGLKLFKQALAQEVKVDFTTMKIGTGNKSTIEEYEALTTLVETYKTIGLSNLQMTETGLIKATSYFTNEDFESEVVITEVGLFGKLETGEEILICYVNDGYGESFPPGNSGNILQKQRSFEFGIDRNTKVTAVVSSTMFATSKDLEEKVDKTRKISTGTGLSGGGDLTKDLDLKLLPATNNSIGGVIPGDNVEIDEKGKISVPGKYTHPAGNGNNHIPIGGRLKDFLKWTAAGVASWGKILASEIELSSIQRFVTDLEKAYWNGKEPAFTKKSAHNKDFGFDKYEVMPGELFPAELGTDFAGILNVTGVKYIGKTYFCTATKKIYLCKIQNSLTYADLEKFVDISHKGLLDKLENLCRVTILQTNIYLGSLDDMSTICSTGVNLFEYSKLEFHFVTTGDDSTISVGTITGPFSRKFAVIATGSLGATAEQRRGYSVSFYYNSGEKILRNIKSFEASQVHLMGIYGYKNI